MPMPPAPNGPPPIMVPGAAGGGVLPPAPPLYPGDGPRPASLLWHSTLICSRRTRSFIMSIWDSPVVCVSRMSFCLSLSTRVVSSASATFCWYSARRRSAAGPADTLRMAWSVRPSWQDSAWYLLSLSITSCLSADTSDSSADTRESYAAMAASYPPLDCACSASSSANWARTARSFLICGARRTLRSLMDVLISSTVRLISVSVMPLTSSMADFASDTFSMPDTTSANPAMPCFFSMDLSAACSSASCAASTSSV
mmetsp:Transcript_22797/g.57994  ORF Transcript_22797/g.57994 Transcript_22797/m.57994 type:complete len:256 (-) Transcript_22797:1416-2183(-)